MRICFWRSQTSHFHTCFFHIACFFFTAVVKSTLLFSIDTLALSPTCLARKRIFWKESQWVSCLHVVFMLLQTVILLNFWINRGSVPHGPFWLAVTHLLATAINPEDLLRGILPTLIFNNFTWKYTASLLFLSLVQAVQAANKLCCFYHL